MCGDFMSPGLGEAMDGLPTALAALGHRCMVISPRHSASAVLPERRVACGLGQGLWVPLAKLVAWVSAGWTTRDGSLSEMS